MMPEDDLQRKARKRAEDKLGFFIHFTAYAMVNLMFFVTWWFTGGLAVFPWFLFPLLGWGIGIAFHAFSVFGGEALVEKMAAKELRRLRKA
ncbi:MAG TPA: 2TM domain-containing protein [Thermoplasmata archaeon]